MKNSLTKSRKTQAKYKKNSKTVSSSWVDFPKNSVQKKLFFKGLYDEKQTHAEVLQFVTLQMALHHPGGARTESEGAVVIDQDQWSSNLSRVFSNLVENTIHNINWRSRSRSFFPVDQ